MKINQEELQHLADLSRLKLNKNQEKEFSKQISSILEYMQELEELDTSKIEPTSHVIDLKNIMREDKIEECQDKDTLLENAPLTEGNFIKTKSVK